MHVPLGDMECRGYHGQEDQHVQALSDVGHHHGQGHHGVQVASRAGEIEDMGTVTGRGTWELGSAVNMGIYMTR